MVGQITIEKVLTEDDVILRVDTEDEEGLELALGDALGMLSLAEHVLVSERMDHGAPPDED